MYLKQKKKIVIEHYNIGFPCFFMQSLHISVNNLIQHKLSCITGTENYTLVKKNNLKSSKLMKTSNDEHAQAYFGSGTRPVR